MPGKYKFPRGTPKPKCLTCGKPVRAHVNKYCSVPCIPQSVRQMAGSKSAAVRTYRNRRRRFEAIFLEMTRNGRKLTKDAILDAFAAIDAKAYHRGYQVVWKRRRESSAA